MGKTIHFCLSVRGVLSKNKTELRKYCRWMLKKDGSKHTPDTLRDALMDALAHGWEVLPIGNCDDFDSKTGCRGHADDEAKRPSGAEVG